MTPTACPSNEPWRTTGRSLPMLDAAAKMHILWCCKVYEHYLWGHWWRIQSWQFVHRRWGLADLLLRPFLTPWRPSVALRWPSR